jgi:hypothetical protein
MRHREARGTRLVQAVVGALIVAAAVPATTYAQPTFASPTLLRLPGTNAAAVAVADVTGDEAPDIVAVNDPASPTPTAARLFVLAGNGDGTFASPVSYATSGDATGTQTVVAADFDADNRADVAVLTSRGLDVFLQRNGTLIRDTTLTAYHGDDRLAADNVDGKAGAEIVAYVPGQRLQLLRRSPSGWTASAIGESFPPGPVTPRAFGVGYLSSNLENVFAWGRDADGAGLFDWYQHGDGSFTNDYYRVADPEPMDALTAVDVTGDGRPDIVGPNATRGAGSHLVVWEVGTGIAPTRQLDTQGGLGVVATGDLDGNLTRDVVTQDAVGIGYFLTQQGGPPLPEQHIPLPADRANASGPNRLAVRDVNGDGARDVVLASDVGITVVLQNDGTAGPPPSGCAAGAFTAEYYPNMMLSGLPAIGGCEARVDHDWGQDSPAPGWIQSDFFSARWTAAPTFGGGPTTFTVRADDGVRLWIDGALVLDGWVDQPATTYTVTRDLAAGTHELRLEYYENTGNAVAQLSWNTAAPPPPAPSCGSGAFAAQYFAGIGLDGAPLLSRCEPAPGGDWGLGSPDAAVPADGFSARWTGTLVLDGGDYTFVVTGDDGIRLRLDGNLLVDAWRDQAATKYSAAVTLAPGSHTLELEYYESGGNAVAKVEWSGPPAAAAPPPPGAPAG